jgi:hypothetical protein
MKSIAACLFIRYKIKVVMDLVPDYVAGGGPKMKGKLPVRFTKREHSM